VAAVYVRTIHIIALYKYYDVQMNYSNSFFSALVEVLVFQIQFLCVFSIIIQDLNKTKNLSYQKSSLY